MEKEEYKQFTETAKLGIKGEAFFQALISDYALAHHISGPKDLGIDYICEWVHGDSPTGILFAVQVKTSEADDSIPKFLTINKEFNGLEIYEIAQDRYIESRTLEYWKGFGIPIYLFKIIQTTTSSGGKELNCYYKRFSPVLTGEQEQSGLQYYKVNQGSKFLAFLENESKERFQGFCRDLFIDYIRWTYYKGSITYLNPRILGLDQFPENKNTVFKSLFNTYKDNIIEVYNETGKLLKHFDLLEMDQN